MSKTILVTGATDGIGFETAKMLLSAGHTVLLHGRNSSKLKDAQITLSAGATTNKAPCYLADMANLDDVTKLASTIKAKYRSLDAVINNAGVFKVPSSMTEDKLDVRFVVNTLAPYILTKALLPILDRSSRVVNVSSAAQAPVSLAALAGQQVLNDSQAYAQSKLALTMWSRQLGLSLAEKGPVVVSVNPKSLLGSKMVKDAYGMAGSDLRVGADILSRAALSDEFIDASGQYYDNDIAQFAQPHPDALNEQKNTALMSTMDQIIQRITSG
ncbi:putative oxidoreductase YciK [Paraglaciecola mesophila]|uniref:Putative oxidoreductase YciK n=1 Tax=Paraglaciecola mesophila TaxID=197222 RepID=A0A857JGG9_9ALTE|nr:SDR family NAD(P)-dependent oxidoreductase [Paraglaciecola mesophila]QHJ11119.1 putative oxidoreductase YciK [Paraglaciecola mesophila]